MVAETKNSSLEDEFEDKKDREFYLKTRRLGQRVRKNKSLWIYAKNLFKFVKGD